MIYLLGQLHSSKIPLISPPSTRTAAPVSHRASLEGKNAIRVPPSRLRACITRLVCDELKLSPGWQATFTCAVGSVKLWNVEADEVGVDAG